MKNEIVGKIMKEFFELRTKIFSYSKDNNDKYNKGKGTKMCDI